MTPTDGELTSKLFAEHYHGALNDAIDESHDRVDARFSEVSPA